MAAPAPPLRPWANLPDDLLDKVLSSVQCDVDRGCAALACRPWREALTRASRTPRPRPLSLPWILLPSADGSFRACCVLSGGAIHGHLRVNPPGARCFGSHDGAWLFLAFPHARVHQLRSVRTGHVHVLPGVFRPFNNARRAGDDMAILAAALSAPPGDATCVAAGIVVRCPNDQHHAADADADDAAPTQPRLVFWRMGADVAMDFSPGPIEPAMEVEDVVYQDGGFHALTHGEHIYAYTPLLSKPPTIGVAEGLRRFLPGDRIYHDDDVVLARYLVVSRGELLMVVRYKPSPTQKTSSFRVFQAVDVEEQMPAAAANNNNNNNNADMDEDHPNPADADNNNSDIDDEDDDLDIATTATWSELDTLAGRMLFVGRGQRGFAQHGGAPPLYRTVRNSSRFGDGGQRGRQLIAKWVQPGAFFIGQERRMVKRELVILAPSQGEVNVLCRIHLGGWGDRGWVFSKQLFQCYSTLQQCFFSSAGVK
ncbi:hypothetical protein ACP70R_003738 [Stipagrostis hirtigluma subsp. patula]